MPVIFAFIAALPVLWKMYEEIRRLTREDPAAFIARVNAVMDAAKSANTSEEKAEAAKRVQNLIHGG